MLNHVLRSGLAGKSTFVTVEYPCVVLFLLSPGKEVGLRGGLFSDNSVFSKPNSVYFR